MFKPGWCRYWLHYYPVLGLSNFAPKLLQGPCMKAKQHIIQQSFHAKNLPNTRRVALSSPTWSVPAGLGSYGALDTTVHVHACIYLIPTHCLVNSPASTVSWMLGRTFSGTHIELPSPPQLAMRTVEHPPRATSASRLCHQRSPAYPSPKTSTAPP
jgi:hypothetical protein